MGRKVRTTLYLDSDIIKEAQYLGLNISKTCENALKLATERLKTLYYPNEAKIIPIGSQKSSMVGSPGFEPESRESKSQSLDHASRRPLSLQQQRKPDFTIQ
jgi:post-segregation antitoxin (ccd killing protein)